MEIIYILKDSLESGLIWSLLALGVFISFRLLDFADLTAEGSIVLGSSLSALFVLQRTLVLSNPFISLFIAFLGGVIAGVVTAFLHTKLKIPGILAGIISMTGLYSINLLVMGKPSLYLGDLKTIYFPLEFFFTNIIIVKNLEIKMFLTKFLTNLIINSFVFISVYWFFGTELGMAIRATGNNRQMAKTQGINTNKMIIIGLGIANGLIALAGALYAQSYKTSNMDIGRGIIVIGLASIILGEALFKRATFKQWLFAVLIGSILFQILIGVAISLGFSPNNLKLLQAILIALVLANPVIKTTLMKIKDKRSKKYANS
ncbi:MAG: hypothetical protein RBS76_00230 [Acholeplasmatales bacterium]|jgi:putative ABC transport system permease protein|nr:hypothetical protein [Acholeplasmataceae bacterium]MDY0114908.1 hypothetical protein [Acholeplasmatales bacterium]MCK9234472.1 hypothetical protein [Acholeplasmataceae bacterium]MCK9289527.1 hypothetical protein [Acholeplasmataceae bacterium]MCK9427151.1 hypothetical protein [Acholeplasmataceae bacterium]